MKIVVGGIRPLKPPFIQILLPPDKSGANYAGLENINMLLMLAGLISFVEILQVKYLDNLIEQDRRFIKKITNTMIIFKAFHPAKATIDGIETTHMI
jgi:putative transposase